MGLHRKRNLIFDLCITYNFSLYSITHSGFLTVSLKRGELHVLHHMIQINVKQHMSSVFEVDRYRRQQNKFYNICQMTKNNSTLVAIMLNQYKFLLMCLYKNITFIDPISLSPGKLVLTCATRMNID